MKIVMWQNMLSHLQLAHIRALAARPDMDVTIVGLGPIPPDRKALGWSVPDFGKARVIDSPDENRVLEFVESCDDQCVHMLAGWRGLTHGPGLLAALRRRSARIGLITEGVDTRGWRGLARRIIYLNEPLRWRKPFDFILTMGTQGAEWFAGCGYPREIIFPYAYLTDTPPEVQCSVKEPAIYELLFVGQMIARKGIDLLFRALSGLPELAWRITLVGDGEEKSSLTRLAEHLGIAERTRFLAAIPNSAVPRYLSCTDLLVLPSRYDGWGAVVNEALMTGVPVLCSDRCAARDLISSDERGEIVPAGSVKGLKAALARRMSAGKRTPELTGRIREWSRCIEGSRGASYILDVLAHVYGEAPRPLPIWSQ